MVGRTLDPRSHHEQAGCGKECSLAVPIFIWILKERAVGRYGARSADWPSALADLPAVMLEQQVGPLPGGAIRGQCLLQRFLRGTIPRGVALLLGSEP